MISLFFLFFKDVGGENQILEALSIKNQYHIHIHTIFTFHKNHKNA